MFKDNRFISYNAAGFQKDMIAGITEGIVAIPLGMAFAIASGVKPEYGLYTTIIAGFLVALFGGSRFQIAGPTDAFIPILLAIVLQYGYEDLLIAGMMAGVFLLLMSFLGVSQLIHFVPRSITIGFTTGIAVIIFTGQLGNFLGLTGLSNHEFFHENIAGLINQIHTINGYSIVTALIGLAVILLLPKIAPRIPLLLVALLIPTIVSFLFFPGQVETIGSAFGGIPRTLTSFHLPHITLSKLITLWQPALIIAALGAIESLLSAVVADGMKNGEKHNSKKELFGQGIANLITPLFGGIPATGAIARTATNIRSGAVSPVSGMVQSAFVLGFLVVFAPYASFIPLASMAPILMYVAWNMSARHAFVHILSLRSSDSIVLLTTFLLTVFINLTVAVQIGILLAALSFLKKMSGKLAIVPQKLSDVEKLKFGDGGKTVRKFAIDGPLFFGTAKRFEESYPKMLLEEESVVILDLEHLAMMDATGEATLFAMLDEAERKAIEIKIKRLPKEKTAILKRSGLNNKIGKENFFM
ncbi:putative sulfate transporter YvdB [Sporosarcina sp. NCCP-2222]|uniref:SulP family inorganic anion transporter n=1 Tax=Sporosarcina sp. NCCP-2222 TaxID=2935073 RepID=UPI002087EE71|nr:SulP family inorganic anion transporter [Sporosarcina sp. NCCP-2222]GKV56761.1 putative sulfate transporter YvdB [Sporosarcina sp. NCCP-2222]